VNKNCIDFTIGADPELAFVDRRSGHIIDSLDWVDEDESLEFGSDGNGVTFELRPSASKNPFQIVNNIHDILIRQVVEKPDFLKFKWVAGSWHRGYPFGGHVHFGLSNRQISHESAVSVLDDYVGMVSILLEKTTDARRRRNDGYGKMGDYREQDWGFEYRAMSSWLSSPYVSAAMLCLSKTVMYEMINNSEFQWHKFAISHDFNSIRHDKILPKFPSIWKDITKMHLYQIYKPYIDLIYFLVTNKLSWLPQTDMKDCWGVIDMNPLINDKVNIDFLWNRYKTEQI